MNLQPLFDAPWAVQAHVATLLPAWIIGTWLLFFSKKGSPLHRAAGRAFLALMTATAVFTLFIHLRRPDSPFFGLSWFHLFVPLVLSLVAIALYGAVSRKIKLHRFTVFGLYFGSLTITGFVNIFLGNGLSHRLFFGP